MVSLYLFQNQLMELSKITSNENETPIEDEEVKDSFQKAPGQKWRKAKCVGLSIFIAKTFEILQNNEYSDVISWNQNGLSFTIKDIEKFQATVLPIYFRHKNFSSFVRQLNMYDFHKIRTDKNLSMFEHRQFKRGRKDQLYKIKRKGCIRKELDQDRQPSQQKIVKKRQQKHRQCVVDQNAKKELIEEFISTLPEIIYSEHQIQQKIRELKFNPKYNSLSSNEDLRKIYKKIKNRKMSNSSHLQELSIQQQIIVDGIDQPDWNPALATLNTEKFIAYRSVSLIASLNCYEDIENLLNI